MFSTTCAGRLAPVMTVETCGFLRHHASDICASVQLSSRAIGASARAWRNSRRVEDALGQPFVALDGGSANPAARRRCTLPVNSPDASGLQIVVPSPRSSYSRAYSSLDPLAVEEIVLRLLRHRLVQVVALCDLPRGCDLVCGPFGRAPIQRLARLNHVVHRPHGLLDRRLGIGTVAEHEIHVIELRGAPTSRRSPASGTCGSACSSRSGRRGVPRRTWSTRCTTNAASRACAALRP